MQQSKKCRKCKINKPLSDYFRHKLRPDGYSYTCKECENINKRKWSKNNKEKIKLAREKRKDIINKRKRGKWNKKKERIKHFKRKYVSFWECGILIEEIYAEIRKQFPNKKERHKQYISYQRHIDNLCMKKSKAN